ncbi:MAG: aminotransferase class III-fold pyridoxal phosphate-dependent enzyme [Pseudomonadota bacterium]
MKIQNSVGQATLGKEDLLAAAGVFVKYTRALGDHLFMLDEDGQEVPVLDLVGGFGASLLGHYHPEVTQVMQHCLDQRRPFLAQGSCRQRAADLKDSLADYLLRHTGTAFSIALLSTGTEAVEAALKHARYAYTKRIEQLATACAANVRELLTRLERGEARIDPALLQASERLLGQEPLASLDDLLAALSTVNQQAFNQQAVIAAFPRAFHGKTMGSLAHTWNRDARLPFIRNHGGACFIEQPQEFMGDVARRSLAYFEFEFSPLRLVRRTAPTLAAVIYEPIRGEGGVLELGPAEKTLLRELRAQYPEVALIADEIQCGLGRTGHPVESHACELPADYLTFAKSLGGGLAKVSAVAVRKDLYHAEFSMLHSSTFAEDDLSSSIARRSLEIIERDDLAGRSAKLGQALLHELRGLHKRWPGVIRDVRGRGCMLGVELEDFSEHPSAVLASLSQQQMLGMLCAGYLLHSHRVRVLPSLGRRRVLRIQPSAYLGPEDIRQACRALEALCALLDAGDAAALLQHVSGPPGPAEADSLRTAAARVAPAVQASPEEPCERVGFIAHLIDIESVREWDPAVAALSDDQLGELRGHMQRALEPQLVARRRVRSPLGREVELALYGILMDAEAIEMDMRFNKSAQIRAQVHHAYRRAREDGCCLVGFGGYTSIVTANCTDFDHDHPAVTTGNALTVATSMAAVREAAREQHIRMADACVAVVGAAGNIGQVHATLLAQECGSLLLLGRTGSQARLQAVVAAIAAELLDTLRNSGHASAAADAPEGRLMAQVRLRFGARPLPDADELAGYLLGESLVRLADTPAHCRQADIVISASNSARTFLDAACFATDRAVLVCDVAVPGDVDAASLTAHANVRLIRGGIVNLPLAPDFDLPGMRLPHGKVYACAGETLLLGLAGIRRDFSKAAISTAQVREIGALARLHGFELVQKT